MSEETARVPVTLDAWPGDADSDEAVVVNWFVREGATVDASERPCDSDYCDSFHRRCRTTPAQSLQ